MACHATAVPPLHDAQGPGAETPRRSTNGRNTEVDWSHYAMNARKLWAGMVWDRDLEGPTTQRCGTHEVTSVPQKITPTAAPSLP